MTRYPINHQGRTNTGFFLLITNYNESFEVEWAVPSTGVDAAGDIVPTFQAKVNCVWYIFKHELTSPVDLAAQV